MELFNVGLPELLIILILMFVFLGPQDMVRTAFRIGGWVRSVFKSPIWREIMNYSKEFRELPQKFIEETGIKETLEEVQKDTQAVSDEIKAEIREVNAAAKVEYGANEPNVIAPPAAKSANDKPKAAKQPDAAPGDNSAPASPTFAPVQSPVTAAPPVETPPSTEPAAGGGSLSAAIAAAANKARENAEKQRALKQAEAAAAANPPSAPPVGDPAAVVSVEPQLTAPESAVQEAMAALDSPAVVQVEETPQKPRVRKPRAPKASAPSNGAASQDHSSTEETSHRDAA